MTMATMTFHNIGKFNIFDMDFAMKKNIKTVAKFLTN